MFREAFAPHHVPALFRISHANTGITIFDHQADRLMDGMPFGGWMLVTWNDQGHL
jgi:probable phosphoglycerate mutase